MIPAAAAAVPVIGLRWPVRFSPSEADGVHEATAATLRRTLEALLSVTAIDTGRDVAAPISTKAPVLTKASERAHAAHRRLRHIAPSLKHGGNTMVHEGTRLEGSAENGGVRRMSRGRIAAWVAAALLLLLPWVAGAPWSVSDFVFAGILLFGSLGAYEVATRMTGDSAYRAGAGVAIAGSFLLIWINAAVGITDSDADGMYVAVIAVGIIGALIARFRPKGLAFAMFATALAHASVGVIALIAGIVPPHNSAFEILGLTAFFVVLFGGSAVLFREAARGSANDA